MKIIIIGLGHTGILLAERASLEHHDVLVIDEDSAKVEAVTDRLNISGVCGSGACRQTLLKAGADLADVVVALTPSDETNLMACAVAKQCGTRFTAARIDQPELFPEKEYYAARFQVDHILTPKFDTAMEIARHIGLPGTVRSEGNFSSEATLIRVSVDGDSPLKGMVIRDVRNFMQTDMLVAAVVRGGKVRIPEASYEIEQGDLISIITANRNLPQIMLKLNLIRRPVKNVLIIGGGDVAYFLTEKLLKEKKTVTILDNDSKRCMTLAKLLSGARISYADQIDANVLTQEGIRSADVCVSLTGQDDTNLVLSMFAWSCGVKSIITKVKLPAYEELLNKVSIDITISPSVICVDHIVQFIRNQAVPNVAGNDIESMYKIADGLAEAVEFTAYDTFAARNIPFRSEKFRTRKGVLAAILIRGGQVMIPDGSSVIKTGDKVVVVTDRSNRLNTLNDILA